MDQSRLDNVVWACLSGPHREFAEGGALALRYRRGYSPIAALAEPSAAAYAELAALSQRDEQIFLPFAGDRPPSPWIVEVEEPVLQMIATAPIVERPAEFAPVRLGDADVPAMMALTPGSFSARLVSMFRIRAWAYGLRTTLA